jgi:hypothetical protein
MTSSKRNALLLATTKLAGLAVFTLGILGGSRAIAAGPAERGSLVTQGASGKVVAAGPIALHVYSQSRGGSVYTVPARTGTDQDCAAPAGTVTPIAADQVAHVSVREGQVACVSTSARGAFELVWHAAGRPAPQATLLANAAR